MCDFVNVGSYASTAWNVASTGLGIATTAVNAIKQSNVNAANNAAVNANAQSQLNQLQVQQSQINKQSEQQQSQIAREAMQQRARLQVSAGESGVAGGVLDRLNHEITQSANDASTNTETNREGRINQTTAQGQSVIAQANTQMRSDKVDWFGLGLQIAGQGAKDFSKDFKERRLNNGSTN